MKNKTTISINIVLILTLILFIVFLVEESYHWFNEKSYMCEIELQYCNTIETEKVVDQVSIYDLQSESDSIYAGAELRINNYKVAVPYLKLNSKSYLNICKAKILKIYK